MEIRGLTLDQIESAMEETTKKYNGNIILKEFVGKPLNKRGDAFRIRIGVKSSRRPGARVSSNPYMDKPKRIASACWHSNRDLFREFFKINPGTNIKTALAHYKGVNDFESRYPMTGLHSVGFGGAYVMEEMCNCDEGEYPEYAVEGLTEDQYQMRLSYWEDEGIKAPKPEKAIL